MLFTKRGQGRRFGAVHQARAASAPKGDAGLHLVFAGLFVGALLLIRTRTPIGEDLFLRSMIPHHSGAILMCEQSSLTNPEVVALCDQIVTSQREEIAQMQAILARQPRP